MSTPEPKDARAYLNDIEWASFLPHLAELRWRLFKCAMFSLCVFVVLMPFYDTLFTYFAFPLLQDLPNGANLQAVGVLSAIIAPLKFVGFLAFILSFPFYAYQGWNFLLPAFYTHERRFALPLVCMSCLFFGLGLAFAHLFVLKKVFAFIISFSPKVILIAPDVTEYMDFCLNMYFGFSVAFQTPVLVVALSGLKIVPRDLLVALRPVFIVLIFVTAAIISPPDVISQIFLALPMWLLYELGLFIAKYLQLQEPPTVRSNSTPSA